MLKESSHVGDEEERERQEGREAQIKTHSTHVQKSSNDRKWLLGCKWNKDHPEKKRVLVKLFLLNQNFKLKKGEKKG